ncbi:MAG: biotin--[acetyl-CoA-carboxylase] ligase [Bacteriovoracaceae bacterium]
MKTVHLGQCNSTQEYLKIHLDNLLIEDKDLLVSTDLQLAGKGRSGNFWHSYEGALAFSFTLTPSEVLTLTSLEVGILISRFFEEKYKKVIQLKWPNDLQFDEGKCGGIIIQNVSEKLIVGVGINLYQGEENKRQDEYTHSFLFGHNIFAEDFKRILPEKIYQYIIDNRLRADEIINEWNKLCVHQNQLVSFENGKHLAHGFFVGLGQSGEALIEEDGIIRSIFSGGLRPIATPQ